MENSAIVQDIPISFGEMLNGYNIPLRNQFVASKTNKDVYDLVTRDGNVSHNIATMMDTRGPLVGIPGGSDPKDRASLASDILQAGLQFSAEQQAMQQQSLEAFRQKQAAEQQVQNDKQLELAQHEQTLAGQQKTTGLMDFLSGASPLEFITSKSPGAFERSAEKSPEKPVAETVIEGPIPALDRTFGMKLDDATSSTLSAIKAMNPEGASNVSESSLGTNTPAPNTDFHSIAHSQETGIGMAA